MTSRTDEEWEKRRVDMPPDAPGLFDAPTPVAPPETPAMTRGERRKALVERRIAKGEHPLGYPVMLHRDVNRKDLAAGPTCGECDHRVIVSHHNRTYPKCYLPSKVGDNNETYPRATGCESSDIRKWWPACMQFKPKGD